MISSADGRVPRARRWSMQSRRKWIGFAFVVPATLFVLLFFITPLAMSGFMSLNDWPLLGSRHFIGLDNYRAIKDDTQFWQALGFTLKYAAIATPVIFLVALGLALLVRKNAPGVGVFRTAFFIPVVLGLGATSYLWIWLFNDQVGVFNNILEGLGILQQPYEFLGDSTTSLISIVIMVVWKTAGFTMLLFVIGMQSIPEDLFEAARVDGAGRWATLVRITLPLLRRTFALALVVSVIGSILAFDQFYIMTSGGPNNETLTAVYWIYNNGFTYYHLGYAAALSMVLLVILLAISVVQLYLLRDTTQL